MPTRSSKGKYKMVNKNMSSMGSGTRTQNNGFGDQHDTNFTNPTSLNFNSYYKTFRGGFEPPNQKVD